MDLRLRRAQQDWLSEGDVAAGIRALDAEDLSPLDALRHPWLEARELRLAYGIRLARRGNPLGEWIAASTRLAAPTGLSLEGEWRLRQRAWTLLNTHGEEWTGGRRHNHSEFLRDQDHPWRLEAGRLAPRPWKIEAAALASANPNELLARGRPRLELKPPYTVEDLGPLFANLAWLAGLTSLALDSQGVHQEDDEEGDNQDDEGVSPSDHDFEAGLAAFRRKQHFAEPPIDLGQLLSQAPNLRELRLIGSYFLNAWVRALPEKLMALRWYADPSALPLLLERTWPSLKRLELMAPWIGAKAALGAKEVALGRSRFPRLEELSLAGYAPPILGSLAPRLKRLCLSAPSDMYLGGSPPTVPGLLAPTLQVDLPQLGELSVHLHRTGAWFHALLAKLPQLRTLHLSNNGLDDEEAGALARLRGLRHLTLGHSQPMAGKGLARLLTGPLAESLRSLDIRGGHGCCGPRRSHYPLGGAKALRAAPNHGLVSLSLPYLTRRSARVLATAPALRSLCELRVGDLRDDAEAIFKALTQKTRFRLTTFEVDSPKSHAEEDALCALWGSRYVRKPDLAFFDFNF